MDDKLEPQVKAKIVSQSIQDLHRSISVLEKKVELELRRSQPEIRTVEIEASREPVQPTDPRD